MGGDYGPSVIVPAAIDALAEYPLLELILVGDQQEISQQLTSHTFDSSRLHIRHASERVLMDDSPAVAMRTKKDSSMRVAINLVKPVRQQLV